MKTHIKNARLIDPASGADRQADVWIADGRILSLSAAPAGFKPDQVIDAAGKLLIPGLVDLAARMRDAGMALGMDRDFWHTPPADILFLHRKLGGLYLLAARLRARVDVRRLLVEHLPEAQALQTA